MGGPSAQQSRFGQYYGKVLQAFPKEEKLLNKFAPGIRDAFGRSIAQGKDFSNAVFGYADPVIAGGGAPTPTQSADWMNAARQIIAPSGNLRTSPSAVAQEMNYTNLEQQRLAQAVGMGATGMQVGLAPAAAAVSAFTGLFDPLLSAASGSSNINAQLGTSANIAGSNKNAALESAGIKAVGDITSSIIGAAQEGGEVTETGIRKYQQGGGVMQMPTLEDIYRLMGSFGDLKVPLKKKKDDPVQQIVEKESGQDTLQKGGNVKKRSTDTVPAMLTPGEYVLNRGAVELFRPQINAMNELGKRHPIMRGGKESRVKNGVLHAQTGTPPHPVEQSPDPGEFEVEPQIVYGEPTGGVGAPGGSGGPGGGGGDHGGGRFDVGIDELTNPPSHIFHGGMHNHFHHPPAGHPPPIATHVSQPGGPPPGGGGIGGPRGHPVGEYFNPRRRFFQSGGQAGPQIITHRMRGDRPRNRGPGYFIPGPGPGGDDTDYYGYPEGIATGHNMFIRPPFPLGGQAYRML
jgi:hypothetical protein